MIDVTPSAKELLRGIELRQDGVLRLDALDSGELGFVAGDAEPDDQVVEEQGEGLLHIAAPVSDRYDGHELDRVDTPQGPELTITRPNEGVAAGETS
jgi:Fe-S cluster assembly iron-binding protein IscA